jgi:cob(I)alamin adenosyltransferase
MAAVAVSYDLSPTSCQVPLFEEKPLHSESPLQGSRPGLVQVFTGDGKGKTTAAVGAAVRALGSGLTVFIAFFMKGNYVAGEGKVLSRLSNITVTGSGRPEFINPSNISKEDIEQARSLFRTASQALKSAEYDLVILDEINLAVAWGLISLDDVLNLIADKPGNVELILTGRGADNRVIKLADLVTDCRNVKHPFNRGIKARQGIEY